MIPEKIGRFTITSELGRGAMGVVYLAEDSFLGRAVAIKTIQVHPGLAAAEVAELRGRFENEARAAATLAHPNMVTIFDAGADEHTLYIAMEYVQGEPLDEILKSDRVLTYKEVADLALQLAGALDYAHLRGIVHRDIKPANILVNRAGQPKITDFGVARQAASTLTATGTIIGTPAYMSPEQITGHTVTGASDQFSLGIVMYEVLTGRKPFFGEGATTILYKIVHEDPTPPGSVQKALPPAIDAIVLRALAKSPEQRYPSCVAFAEELRRVLGAAPAEEALRLTATASTLRRPDSVHADADAETSLHTGPRGTPVTRPAVAPASPTQAAAGEASPMTRPALIAAGVVLAMAMGAYIVLGMLGGEPDTVDPVTELAPAAPQADPFAAADGLGEPLLEGFDQSAVTAAAGLPAVLSFRVTSRPAGAQVMLDGKRLEQQTPVVIEVSSADRHTILLEHIGHRSVSWAFVPKNMSPDQIQTGALFFPLDELPTGAAASAEAPVVLVAPDVPAGVAEAVAAAGSGTREEEELEPVDPIRIQGNARNLEKVEVEERVDPVLPDWAREQGLPSYVVLELVIDRRGRVRDARVLRPVHPTLETIAIDAVRGWRFRPARRNGEPVDAYLNVSVQFRGK